MRPEARRVSVLRILFALALVWGALVVLVWVFQRKLIYFPGRGPVPPVSIYIPTAEEVSFRTEDGLDLAGWFVHGRGGTGRTTVLVFNGNGGDRSMRVMLAQALRQAGLSVMLFDYRGYGGNPGTPTEQGLAADARAARSYLAARSDIDPTRLVYFGESLGCAVAVGLATSQPPAAMVLRSPFTTLAEAGRFHYPYLPVGLLLADRYPSLEHIGAIGCPLLVIAGDADRIVPPSMSRRLYDAAREPRRFLLIPGADHNDMELLAGTTLMKSVLSFVSESVPAGSPAITPDTTSPNNPHD
jgi:fermentation-respiration switch protein FrsA (DUF1100 family)